MKVVPSLLFLYYSLFFVSASSIKEDLPFPPLLPWMGMDLPRNGSSQDKQCQEDSKMLKESFERRELWAVRMVDASALSVTGALWGARYQLGSYDACRSVAASSPVGARYCLVAVRSRWRPAAPAPGPGPAPGPDMSWLSVEDVGPRQDARAVLTGAGQVAGFHPPGEVLVAQCVPLSCRPGALQAALRMRAPGQPAAPPPHPLCTHWQKEGEGERSVGSVLVWCFLVLLVCTTIAAPHFGWSWWDWRRHLRALGRPDAPLQGLDLTPLSGLRFLTALLMVLAHRVAMEAHGPTSHQLITRAALSYPPNAIQFHADIYNATFFFISGVLTILCKSNHGVLRSIFIRYFRIMPLYLLTMAFITFALPGLGEGPLWNHLVGRESKSCRQHWWTNILFINNYYPFSEESRACMFQTWYLAVEMQLFLASLLLRPESRGWRALLAALALSTLPRFLGTLRYGWPALIPMRPLDVEGVYDDPWFKYDYVPMHMNAAPFVCGLMAGRLLLRLKEVRSGVLLTPRVTWSLTLGGVLVLIASMLSSLLYVDPDRPYSALDAALYVSLGCLLWCGALAALLVALVFGEPTPLRSLLSWQPMVTLSRLSYGLYLFGFSFQTAYVAALTQGSKTSVITAFFNAVGDTFYCLLASFVLYVILEAPARIVTKELLDRPAPKLNLQDTSEIKKER